MAFRCGTDIVFIPHMRKLLESEAMLKRFFSANELSAPKLSASQNSSVSMEHLAGVIAAKEAFFKALGKSPKFHEIEIAHEVSGRPKLIVAPLWHTFKTADVSISHDKDYATAVVILEL